LRLVSSKKIVPISCYRATNTTTTTTTTSSSSSSSSISNSVYCALIKKIKKKYLLTKISWFFHPLFFSELSVCLSRLDLRKKNSREKR
jgi:hypothetical protein